LPVFNLKFPTNCPSVPSEILNPRNTWADKAAYDAKANSLANSFIQNFEQYAAFASKEILEAAPKVTVTA
jgi:phosphoenolpyruvate carboxykinase (ATP)